MNTRQLRYFVAIVDEGSVSKAALKLHIAQPALSQHIFNLEEELDTELLVRSSRGVAPTAAGKVLYEHARKIAAQLKQAALDVRFEANTPKGEVTIVFPPMLGEHIAPRLILQAAEQFPEITLRILQGHSLDANTMIETGRADLGIISNDGTVKRMNVLKLYREPLFLVEKLPPNAKPRQESKQIFFDDAVSKPLTVTREKHAVRTILDRTSEDRNIPLNIRTETESSRLHRGYIRHGVGAAVLPWPSLYSMWLEGEVQARQIIKPKLIRQIYLAWPKDYPLNAATHAIRTLSLEILAQLFESGVVKGTPQEGLNDYYSAENAK